MSDDFVRNNTADQEKKVDAEKLLVGGLEIFRYRMALPAPAMRYRVVGSAIYIGEAPPGTADSTVGWRIKKLLTSGSDFDILWANGTSDYVHVWNNWNLLTYS